MLYKSLVRPIAEYAFSVWSPATTQLQRQLEQVQEDFLKSIRLSKATSHQHDSDSSHYRQHLDEVQWEYLWMRRCRAVLANAFRIWKKTFPEGHLILKTPVMKDDTQAQIITRSQTAKATASERIRLIPATKMEDTDTLEVASNSFAYCVSALIDDALFCQSALDCRSLHHFMSYANELDLRCFQWCKKNIDSCLI